jgi:hypothetical protein
VAAHSVCHHKEAPFGLGQPGILILLSLQSDIRKQGTAQLKSGGWIHGIGVYCEQKGVESPRFLPELSQNQVGYAGFFSDKKGFEELRGCFCGAALRLVVKLNWFY